MTGKTAPHIKPGLYIALALISLTLVFYFTGIKTGNAAQMALRVLIVAVGVTVAAYRFAQQNATLAGKDIFFHGFRVTAITTLCTIAFGVLFVLLVPQFKQDAVATFQQEQLLAKDGATPARIAENLAMYKKRFLTLFIGMNMMIVVVSGLIGSLAGALISSKKQ